jgi:hypothetical protein
MNLNNLYRRFIMKKLIPMLLIMSSSLILFTVAEAQTKQYINTSTPTATIVVENDGGSPPTQARVRVNDGEWSAWTIFQEEYTTPVSLTLIENTTNIITVEVEELSGNIGVFQTEVDVDTILPKITITINGVTITIE